MEAPWIKRLWWKDVLKDFKQFATTRIFFKAKDIVEELKKEGVHFEKPNSATSSNAPQLAAFNRDPGKHTYGQPQRRTWR